jgi:hypothetical protein
MNFQGTSKHSSLFAYFTALLEMNKAFCDVITRWMKEGPCQPEEIKKALMGAMIMDILPLASREEITVSKRVSLSKVSK